MGYGLMVIYLLNNMNYGEFKSTMVELFVFKESEAFEEEDLNDFYTIFKNMWFDTVEDWCEFYFKDWNLDTHCISLKSKIK